MSLYISKSKEVLSIYLEFVSHEDMHVYSIDEVFLDVTDYLKMYKMKQKQEKEVNILMKHKTQQQSLICFSFAEELKIKLV